MNTLMKFVLHSSYLLLHVFSWTSQALESHTFHTVDTGVYLPTSDVCNSIFTAAGSENKRSSSTLKIVDKFSPCFSHNTRKPPSLQEILSHDQYRVDSIHKRGQSKLESHQSFRPILPPELFNSSNYVVTIGLGEPEQQVSFLFSTSTDNILAQCAPLYTGDDEDKFFNSSASTAFSYIPCDAPKCTELVPHPRNCSASNTYCNANVTDDANRLPVNFAKDNLTIITTDDVSPDFVFGCTGSIPELEGNIVGILGFSRSNFSFVYQMNDTYNQVFSYCLPKTSSQIGYLRFGTDKNNNTKLTDLVDCPSEYSSNYCVDITSITVGGVQLQINQSVFETAGTMIDSDTTYTYLPPDAYTQLSTAFKQQMTNYTVAPSYYSFDTCFDTSNSSIINVPTISFTFGNVMVDLDPSGILVPTDNSSVSCLAFIGNNDPDTIAVFGSTQQKTLKVMYDVVGGKIGFGHGDCFKFGG